MREGNSMTPTAYIVTPISTPPEKNGWYNRINENIENAQALPAYYYMGKWYENKLRATENINPNPSYMANMAWLRPLDLSTLLGECWDASSNWENNMKEGDDCSPDKETYINSIINPQK